MEETKAISIPEKNAEKAISLLTILAEAGQSDAQFLLGELYIVDDIIEHDFALGIEWLKKAAENGHADSMYLIGHCYENGLGVLKNSNDAIFWYRKASDLGHEDATERLEQIDEY